jgi:hypothetical protein
VLTTKQARLLALSLPEVTEQDHHGRPSFRIRGKIIATLWTATAMNIMLDEPGILSAVDAAPDICSEVHWGHRLMAVQVELTSAEPDLLESLLAEAWGRRAPHSLVTATGYPFARHGGRLS